MDTRNIFSQHVLAAITLLGGGGLELERLRLVLCMREGLPICSVTTTTLSGAGSDPKLLEQKT